MTSFRVVETAVGSLALVVGEAGLKRTYLPQRSETALRRQIDKDYPEAVENDLIAPQLVVALERYFAGEAVKFDVERDETGATRFQRAVWQACAEIPAGETVSYSELAERAGKPGAARAVGSAMRRNRWPLVVPCHRVLRRDGGLGGFSAAAGVSLKRRLLELEKANTALI